MPGQVSATAQKCQTVEQRTARARTDQLLGEVRSEPGPKQHEMRCRIERQENKTTAMAWLAANRCEAATPNTGGQVRKRRTPTMRGDRADKSNVHGVLRFALHGETGAAATPPLPRVPLTKMRLGHQPHGGPI